MNFLLDTHAFLWFIWDDPLLSATARDVIVEPSHRKLVSIASCWEIAIKTGLGKLDLGESSQAFLSRELAINNFELLPISLEHATAVEGLPQFHRDPFDRMLVAQAQSLHCAIVSADAVLDQYGVGRIW